MSKQRGFTLVELIVVMVVIGIMAGILVVFFSPALSNYFDTARRAGLSDVADGAMRRIVRDVRMSVPNSVRSWGNQCVEMVPTSSGGRYRTGPDIDWDTANAANPSLWMDPGQTYSTFDTVTQASTQRDDWVVIGNQESDDIYLGTNRQLVDTAVDHVGGTPGFSRITLKGDIKVPAGYDGARYVVVPGGQGPVTYTCQGEAGTDAAGSGKLTLQRLSGYGFPSPASTSCPASAAVPAIVASHVSACTFRYESNPGATQESGFLEVDITVTEANESVRLRFGVHVDNVP